MFFKSIRALTAMAITGAALTCQAADGPALVPGKMILTNLVFDSETQIYHATADDTQASFTFKVTNVSDVPVHILSIPPSCSCTHAEMPQTPWIIPPHTNEVLHVTMQINKLPLENQKYVTILATNGTKQLWVKSIRPAPAAATATNAAPEKK